MTHGGPIRAIFREILGKGEIHPGDCSYAVLQYSSGKLTLQEVDGIELE